MKYDGSFYFASIKNYLDSYYSFEKERFKLFDFIKLGQLLKVFRPDVVFTFSTLLGHYAMLLELFGGFSYRLINGSIRNAPINLDMQTRFEKIMYNFYKEVVANSKAGLKAYGQIGKKGRHVLNNGFDKKRVPKTSKNELRHQLGVDDKFTVVMVASMGDSKDQTSFIKAAANVLKVTDDVQFYLIGDGPKKSEYLNLVSALGLEKDVFFTGIVINVEEYLKGSDLSVLMSTNAEGFPNVVLESLACGTPVIASQGGGIEELIINGENGYLVNEGDFEMLSNRIEYLYKNSDILETLSYNAEKLARNKFSIDAMIRTFEEILDNRNFYMN